MLGGYNVFGKDAYVEKTFALPAVHVGLRVQLKFFKIDRWDNEYGFVTVDGVHAWSQMFRNSDGKSSSECGYPGRTHPSYNDMEVEVDVTVPHTASTATIKIHTNMNDRDEWWGIQDVRLTTVLEAAAVSPSPPSAPGAYTLVAANSFPMDLEGWTGSCGKYGKCPDGFGATSTYTCGSFGTMVGGFNVFGRDAFAQKTFDVGGEHTHLRVQLRFYKIDRWDNEYGFVTVDGVHAWSRMFRNNHGERMCGYGGSTAQTAEQHSSYNDMVVEVDAMVPHTAETAVVKVSINLQDRDEWWGFGDVRITAVSMPAVMPPPSAPGSFSRLSAVPVDLEGWTGSCGKYGKCPDGFGASSTYTCGSFGTMVGGFNVFGRDAFAQKTFDVGGEHTHLRVQLRFYKIDRWDNEYGFVTVDGVHAWSRMFRNNHGERMCGYGGSTAQTAEQHSSYNDMVVEVDAMVPHTAETAVVKVFTNLQDRDEWWGFGDVRITAMTTQEDEQPVLDGWEIFAKDSWPGAIGWTGSVPLSASTMYTCGSWTMLGGYQVFGRSAKYVQKTFTNLKPHQQLRVTFSFFKIDRWDNEYASLLIDNKLAWGGSNRRFRNTDGEKTCGYGGSSLASQLLINAHPTFNDQMVRVDVVVPHVGSNVTVKVEVAINDNDEFWGIQDVVLMGSDTPFKGDAFDPNRVAPLTEEEDGSSTLSHTNLAILAICLFLGSALVVSMVLWWQWKALKGRKKAPAVVAVERHEGEEKGGG